MLSAQVDEKEDERRDVWTTTGWTVESAPSGGVRAVLARVDAFV